MQQFNYDILIVGAGRAGTSTAIALSGSGLKVALLDKSTSPRDHGVKFGRFWSPIFL